MDTPLIFYLLMMILAYLYACVGHGGASGYIALMTLFEFSPDWIRPAALLLNICVSLFAFSHFYRAGYFRWKLFYPFAIASVPASFLGGRMAIEDHYFKVLLGVLLLFPILNLFGAFHTSSNGTGRKLNVPLALAVGGGIGFISGLIGIGGGILLSPFLLLMRWADMKETAAVSALYIFVNSVSGLTGQASLGLVLDMQLLLLIPIVLFGAWAGAYLGAYKFHVPVLKRMLALVLLMASLKLVLL